MNEIIAWLAAEAELPDPAKVIILPVGRSVRRSESLRGRNFSTQALPAHQFPSTNREQGVPPRQEVANPEAAGLARDLDDPLDRNPDLGRYRGLTVILLRRYLRYSLEAGRLPSILGSEFFRTQVTSYGTGTFEDRVIFVHDVEICLEKLDKFSRNLIARHILQEHNRWATAKLLHCNEKSVRRNSPIALDLLSEIFLDAGILEPQFSNREKPCQGGKNDEFSVSDCEDGK
jgi:hypothetical protein